MALVIANHQHAPFARDILPARMPDAEDEDAAKITTLRSNSYQYRLINGRSAMR